MIKFITLSLKNFLSYGNVPTVVQLDRPGTTLILGEDLDNTGSGIGANGVGKTVLINALTYAIYDKAISDISKDNLVNNINKKNMEVVVEFEKDNHIYKIIRVRKCKVGAAGNYVQLFEDDHDITPDSVSNTNKLIEKIIGIPYELFVRIVVFSATLIPFLDLPVRSHYAANQTDIIEELFNYKTLSEKANVLKEVIKGTETRLEIKKTRVDVLIKEFERLEKQIGSAEQRVSAWDTQNQMEIVNIQNRLKKIESVDIVGQQVLHDQLGEIDDQLSQNVREQNDIRKQIKKQTKIVTDISAELDHLQNEKCPYCLQKFADTDKKVQECKDTVSVATIELSTLDVKFEKIDKQVETLATKHKDTKSLITVRDFDDILDIKNKSTMYETKLNEMDSAINPHHESLEELQEIKLDPIDMDEINELTSLIEHQKFLLKLLTRKDSFVRKALIHKNIPFLNSRLQKYLTDLELPHTVEFTHEMTAKISQFGRPMDFGNLSNGQRARVNLALSFAFRDVLQSMHDRINVFMLDEVLDVGLDTVGIQNAARMLKRKARDEGLSVYIISHRNNEIDNAFDNIMTVQLSKGFSYINNNE